MAEDLAVGMGGTWERAYTEASGTMATLSKMSELGGAERMQEMVRNLEKSITQTLTRQLASDVPDIKEAMKEIKEVFYDKNHIKAIAEDEVITINSIGVQDKAVSQGYQFKSWHSRGDGKVRPSHRFLNGQKVGINEAFTTRDGVKLQYPCDPAAPIGETARCRCEAVYTYEW